MRELCALWMMVALAAGETSAQEPITGASPRPITTRTLTVTPRAGTIVQRGQTVEFRLAVSGAGPIEQEYVLTRAPEVVVGRVVNTQGAAVIPFVVPPESVPGRLFFRATATPTARALRRPLAVDTHLLVGPAAGGAPSPSPSPPSPSPSPPAGGGRPASP